MTDTALAERTALWSAEVETCCAEVGVVGVRREIVLLILCDGFTIHETRLKLKIKRVSEVQREYAIGLAKLSALPDFWHAASAFERDLLMLAGNKEDYDERPAGVCGVTPHWEPDRLRGARVVGQGDPRLKQDLFSAGWLWAINRRPARVEVPALET